MKKKYSFMFIFLSVIIFFSCGSQRNTAFIPIPDESFFELARNSGFYVGEILETRDGIGADYLPNWLSTFLSEGIEAVENLETYSGKYIFIQNNQGENFTILNRWSDFFSEIRDLPSLVAARIERRLILMATLYPDDEYGLFFERFIKNAYNTEYPQAVKEDTFWIKTITESGSEVFMFFVFVSIDRTALEAAINNMIDRTITDIAQSGRRPPVRRGAFEIAAAQASAVNNLKFTFFEDF